MSLSSFEFYDARLLELVKRGDPHVHQFFRLLAVCHTVMPEEKNGTVYRWTILSNPLSPTVVEIIFNRRGFCDHDLAELLGNVTNGLAICGLL